MFSSVIVFNEGILKKLKGQSEDEYLDEMLKKNLAKKEHYRARKAITFEDLSTGCLCHIIEIGVDSSICLYGQYLYDYVEIADDPELNQQRKFPTSQFALIRKNKNHEILRIDIGDEVIEEVNVENPKIDRLYELGIKLDDGELIKKIPFSRILEAVA
ncbi:hypothetical protein [Microbulbifer thermotolerans]|nr:hypothetical protein [Microbulbifer thermotolerans]MCX2832848.1 hypothetical protein [Microbulbifer thermotolerans]MCX2836136.1 hypothetical protein [Microbulbifer thermotolerans]MCX2841590.1 hypothetical protein [Microbulbifer thermotolerans]